MAPVLLSWRRMPWRTDSVWSAPLRTRPCEENP